MKQETEDKNLTRKDTLQENQELIITTHLKQSTKSTDFINEKSIEDDPIGTKSKKNTVDTKESILQEALKLFAQNGYEATSMSDIAKRLGISKAALYKHYQGKQEIFDQIVDRMNQLYDERSQKYHMPKGTFSQMSREYIEKPLE